jgi:membrane-bound lytic murein transglycosylase A
MLSPVDFASLVGWRDADLTASLAAFQRSAAEMQGAASGFRRPSRYAGHLQDWQQALDAAQAATDPHRFFEQLFQPYRVQEPGRPEGLFTGYYVPLVQGSRTPHPDYPVPVYGRPSDLVSFTAEEVEATGMAYGRRVNGKATPYATRRDIETGETLPPAPVICWLRDWVDAFFMHVQGQGRVALNDGGSLRLSYAAKSGHPYTGIGHVLIEKGVAPRERMSMQVLRDWMRANPQAARELMWINASYIFFQSVTVADETLGGVGAAKVPLTPEVSLAVDRSHWMFGTPLWINTTTPPEAEPPQAVFSKLMIAQDTGSAIKGLVRGDVFWGWGARAEHMAGHMKSPGHMVALLPRGYDPAQGRVP